jgi:hypothetical protein
MVRRCRLAGIVLAVVSLFAAGCSVTPAGGDPGGRRLKELSDDDVFAALPDGAKMFEETRTPASYQRPVFSGGGWRGPSVVIVFKSSAPPAEVYGFYARHAVAAGWRATGAGGLGFTNRWSKTYPDGAEAWLFLALLPSSKTRGPVYSLDGGIAPVVPG